jgi:hypothetical protein
MVDLAKHAKVRDNNSFRRRSDESQNDADTMLNFTTMLRRHGVVIDLARRYVTSTRNLGSGMRGKLDFLKSHHFDVLG